MNKKKMVNIAVGQANMVVVDAGVRPEMVVLRSIGMFCSVLTCRYCGWMRAAHCAMVE